MKVVINGEAFDYDMDSRPMSEAIAIEKAWGRRYAEFQQEWALGSAEAWAVFAWVVWRRHGRDVELSGIFDGTVDFDLQELIRSVNAGREEQAKAEAEGPTSGASPLTGPDGTDTTPAGTSESSRKSSESAPGKSGS